MDATYLGLIGYLVLMLAVGLLTWGRNRTTEDFILGGRKLGAWVIAGTTGAASALFLRAALDHWQSARLLDARSHDPSREFGDRRSLHQQAVEEWEFGNRSRNLAAASGLAALASSALLLHLYGDRSEASRMKLRCATPAAGGLAVGWTFSF